MLRPRKKGGDFYGIAATRHGLTSQDFVEKSAAAVFQKRTCTIWLFNIAMENHHL